MTSTMSTMGRDPSGTKETWHHDKEGSNEKSDSQMNMKTREKVRNVEHLLFYCFQPFTLREKMNIKINVVIKDNYE